VADDAKAWVADCAAEGNGTAIVPLPKELEMGYSKTDLSNSLLYIGRAIFVIVDASRFPWRSPP
jgi:hypothetical protein